MSCCVIACIHMDVTNESKGGSSKEWSISIVNSGQQVMLMAVSCIVY